MKTMFVFHISKLQNNVLRVIIRDDLLSASLFSFSFEELENLDALCYTLFDFI